MRRPLGQLLDGELNVEVHGVEVEASGEEEAWQGEEKEEMAMVSQASSKQLCTIAHGDVKNDDELWLLRFPR